MVATALTRSLPLTDWTQGVSTSVYHALTQSIYSLLFIILWWALSFSPHLPFQLAQFSFTRLLFFSSFLFAKLVTWSPRPLIETLAGRTWTVNLSDYYPSLLIILAWSNTIHPNAFSFDLKDVLSCIRSIAGRRHSCRQATLFKLLISSATTRLIFLPNHSL